MRMIARGGAMAAMRYLPVALAADNKILPPVNHECQPINLLKPDDPRYFQSSALRSFEMNCRTLASILHSRFIVRE